MKHWFFFSILIICALLSRSVPGWAGWDDLSLHQAGQLTGAAVAAHPPPGQVGGVASLALPDEPLALVLDKKFSWNKTSAPAAPAQGQEPPVATAASGPAPAPVHGPDAPPVANTPGVRIALWGLAGGVVVLLVGWVVYTRSRRRGLLGQCCGSGSQGDATVACELCCLATSLIPLVGRRALVRQLDACQADPQVAMVACIAAAGVGKSALVEGWLDHIRPHFGGARKVFAWSFQHTTIARSLASQQAEASGGGSGSSGLFFTQALPFFGHEGPLPNSEEKRAIRLGELLAAQPAVLILDGVDPLQYPADVVIEQAAELADSFADPGLYHLLRHIGSPARANQHAHSLVLLTSRRPLGGAAGVAQPVPAGASRWMILDNLTEREGVQLLKSMGIDKAFKPLVRRFPAMVRALHGHALTLLLLGGLLAQQRPEWQVTADELEALLAPGALGEHLSRLLDYYDRQIWPRESLHGLFLRLFGLFDRPMREEEWQAVRAQADLAQPLREMDFVTCATLVSDLEQAGFLLPYSAYCGWQLHALVRDYFTHKLEEEYSAWVADVDDAPPAWENSLHQAHGVLFDYFQKVLDEEQPDQLAALEPLYRAVQHGCRAGRYKEALHEVYVRRIRRGTDYFSLAQFGAYSAELIALAGFFPNGWAAPPVKADLAIEDRAWLLAEAAFCLTLLGRVQEALAPQERGLRLELQRDPQGGARAASALCDLQMAAGKLRAALATAEHGEAWAKQHDLPVLQWLLQTKRAIVLHRLGEWSASLAVFQEVERLPTQITPDYLSFMGLAERAHMDLLVERQILPWAELLQRAERVQKQAEFAKQPLWMTQSLLSTSRVLAAMGQGEAVLTPLATAIAQTHEREGETPLLADILYHRAILLRQQGDLAAARLDLDKVLEIARRWGLPLLAVDGKLLEGELLLDAQRPEEAEACLVRAEAGIAEMEYGQRREAALALRTRWAAAGEPSV
ncbi:MAG: hypothetical protein HQL87_15280 [Magnetococcales bacterium]|nr:hypothetical protein [Magnetococcales bacterium]